MSSTHVVRITVVDLFLVLLIGGLAICCYPGIHYFDTMDICRKGVLLHQFLDWHPIYLQLFIRLLSLFGPPIALLFLVQLALLAISIRMLVRSVASNKQFAQCMIVLLLLVCPLGMLSLIKLTKDSLVAGVLLLLVVCVRQYLNETTAQRHASAVGSLIIALLVLMIRPTMILAVAPFVAALIWGRSRRMPLNKKGFVVLFVSLVFVLVVGSLAHLGLKKHLVPNAESLGGSAYHVYLHDVVVISRLRGVGLRIDGFPRECDVSAKDLAGFEYPTFARIEQIMRRIAPKECYRFRRAKQPLLRVAWLQSIKEHPVQYVHARMIFTRTLIGMPRLLRTYPYYIAIPTYLRDLFSKEVFERCLGRESLFYPPVRLLEEYFRVVGSNLVFSGASYLLGYAMALLVLVRMRKRISRSDFVLVLTIFSSGLGYFLTLVFLAPATCYRYLTWFAFAFIVGGAIVMLSDKSSSKHVSEQKP